MADSKSKKGKSDETKSADQKISKSNILGTRWVLLHGQ